jgi:hypothetical protein
MWIVQDDGVELGVGDRWQTRLEVSLTTAEEVAPGVAPTIRLSGDALSVEGPTYDIVARVEHDETIGGFLDTGAFQVAPDSYNTWPVGSVLRIRSELSARPCPFSEPPDPLIREWTVERIFVRRWGAAADSDPNSFRRDLADVRFQPIERMSMWGDEGWSDAVEKVFISDYLLEVS